MGLQFHETVRGKIFFEHQLINYSELLIQIRYILEVHAIYLLLA